MTPMGTFTGSGRKVPKNRSVDLDSKAQTILVATALGNEGAIRIIQMKIAGKLFWGRFANIAAIPLLLFLGQVINRHTAPSRLSVYQVRIVHSSERARFVKRSISGLLGKILSFASSKCRRFLLE